jgi:hypothetical protein
MVASNMSLEFQEHITDRILGRLCEAAELVSADLTANRFRLRELLDDLAFELDAGDLALSTLDHQGPYETSSGTGVVS